MTKYQIPRDSNGNAEAYAWPGGYPIFYLCDDGGILCPSCCNTERELIDSAYPRDGWNVVGAGVNYEDPDMYCDHCGKRIDPAYCD